MLLGLVLDDSIYLKRNTRIYNQVHLEILRAFSCYLKNWIIGKTCQKLGVFLINKILCLRAYIRLAGQSSGVHGISLSANKMEKITNFNCSCYVIFELTKN